MAYGFKSRLSHQWNAPKSGLNAHFFGAVLFRKIGFGVYLVFIDPKSNRTNTNNIYQATIRKAPEQEGGLPLFRCYLFFVSFLSPALKAYSQGILKQIYQRFAKILHIC